MRPGCFGIVILLVIPAFALTLRGAEPLPAEKAKADPDGTLLWYDVSQLPIEGRGWTDTKSFYDRLPAKAEHVVRKPVWDLSHDSAGLCAHFTTNAPEIHVRWTLTSSNLAMPHMPATGVSGLDLYVLRDGKWRWLSVGQPTATTKSARLISGLPAGEQQYRLYLPLYNGVSSVELGIARDATLAPADFGKRQKPVVFYGTSITQGGCASRPGSAHVAILGRRLNVPIINLGFSGNGKMEPEMADLLTELDPALYVIDCVPNMTGIEVAERAEPLVKKLRAAHPDCPILLVDHAEEASHPADQAWQTLFRGRQGKLAAACQRLHEAGITNLHFLSGKDLLGHDGEGTVDGVHPNDLGFERMADAFEPVLRKLLNLPPDDTTHGIPRP